jgi:predicted TIM-barrel fold metal-dependent hydrolase
MDKGGVDKSIIFPVFYKDYKKPNEEMAELAEKNNRFIGFGRVNSNVANAAGQVDYAVKELGLRGIKLHSMDGFPSRELMDRISEYKIPVLAHSGMGLSPLVYEGIIQSYPDIIIILAHLGFDLNWSTMFSMPMSAFYLAKKYKNVYLDTAAATWVQYILEQAVEEVGPDKILFGTDAPWFYPSIMKACINDLEISDGDKQKIFGGNIARILNL